MALFSRQTSRNHSSHTGKYHGRLSRILTHSARRLSAVESLERRDLLTVTPFSAESMIELPDVLDISSIASEDNGNLVVYGRFSGTVDFDPGPGDASFNSSSDRDLFVAKYGPAGNLIAAVDLSDGDGVYDPGSVAVDSAGDVFVGFVYDGAVTLPGGSIVPAPAAGYQGTIVAKLDSSLQNLLWTVQGSSDELRLTSLAVDGTDSYVYAAGSAFRAGSFGDASFNTGGTITGTIAKIDASNGEIQWLHTVNPGGVGVAIDRDDSSAIYLLDARQAYRMDSAGNIIWETIIDDSNFNFGRNVTMVGPAAAGGQLFIAGCLFRTNDFGPFVLTPTGGDGECDAFTAAVDGTTGAFNWAVQAGGSRNDRTESLAVDRDGSLFIVGEFEDIATFGNDSLVARGEFDRFVSQLDVADGTFTQSWRYGRATVAAAAASPGNLYVAGRYNAANIDFPSGDLPQASSGVFEYALRFATAADPNVPRINGFLASPRPAEPDELLSLDVLGLHDPGGRVESVAFYHDVDGNRRLDPLVDQLLAVDSDGANGWGVDVDTGALPLGDLFLLAQATYDGGATSLAVSEEVFHRNPSTNYVSTEVGQEIRDLRTIRSDLMVPDSFVISDVDVSLSVTHTNNTDLDVYLVHPDGTRIELFTDLGEVSGGAGLANTVLDDQADYSIASFHRDAPITGTFRPEGLLSVLNGKDSQGLWTLEITDDDRKDTGILDAWTLTLAPETVPAPSFSIDDVTITEGDSGATSAVFTVTRSGEASQQVSVDYATADDSATSTSDYEGVATTTLTFAPGVTSIPISITVYGDADEESDEMFFVSLTNPVGGTIADGQGVGTILDDDSQVVTSALFVYDIRFESKRGGKDHRAVFEIRTDSNGDGLGTSDDAPIAGVEVTVTFAGMSFSGTTDASGVFRTSWIKNTPSGDHFAEIQDLALAEYLWDQFLDLEDDSDGDGKPDAVLTI
ncbi:MAG: proprotein convertase P-domain-containing protein [Planctomycetales bacterium]|nr:proprotein convertase P-domain-containing protein [Planctomycetales bacterium]